MSNFEKFVRDGCELNRNTAFWSCVCCVVLFVTCGIAVVANVAESERKKAITYWPFYVALALGAITYGLHKLPRDNWFACWIAWTLNPFRAIVEMLASVAQSGFILLLRMFLTR